MGKNGLKKKTEDKEMENSNTKKDTELKNEEKTPKKEKQKFNKVSKNKKDIEKEMEKMVEKRKKRKKRIIVTSVTVGIIIVVALFISTIFALVNINNDKIMSGISIEGIDMSGLTKEEAMANLQSIYDEKKEKEIAIKYEDF